jgi:hypothetical protein
MKLRLSTWQRLQLLLLMNNVQGDLRTVRKALKLIDIFEMTKEEESEIGLQATPGGFTWRPTDKRWELEIKDSNLVAFLKEHVQAKQDWPAAAGREVMDLCKQLGINFDDDAPNLPEGGAQ